MIGIESDRERKGGRTERIELLVKGHPAGQTDMEQK